MVESLGGGTDGVSSSIEQYLDLDKDDVFEMLDNIPIEEENEMYGWFVRRGESSPLWGAEQFWNPNGANDHDSWNSKFAANERDFFFQLQEHLENRTRGLEEQKDMAEEQRVQYEQHHNGEDYGHAKGAEGGYLGGMSRAA